MVDRRAARPHPARARRRCRRPRVADRRRGGPDRPGRTRGRADRHRSGPQPQHGVRVGPGRRASSTTCRSGWAPGRASPRPASRSWCACTTSPPTPDGPSSAAPRSSAPWAACSACRCSSTTRCSARSASTGRSPTPSATAPSPRRACWPRSPRSPSPTRSTGSGSSGRWRNRDLIGQAKGIIMCRYGVHADEAFEVLRRRSQRTNCKLLAVAEQVVETGMIDGVDAAGAGVAVISRRRTADRAGTSPPPGAGGPSPPSPSPPPPARRGPRTARSSGRAA